MHYVDHGEGTPLVMLHGRGSMIQELKLSGLYELAAARYRLLVPDRPGHGHSSRPRSHWWGPHAQAVLLRGLLARLGIECPILFGHSFGALVALAYALEYPAATRARLPKQPKKEHQAALKKLEGASGEQFDRAYMEQMVKDHEKTLKLVQDAAKNAKDRELKQAAEKAVPDVQKHLEMARKIADQKSK